MPRLSPYDRAHPTPAARPTGALLPPRHYSLDHALLTAAAALTGAR